MTSHQLAERIGIGIVTSGFGLLLAGFILAVVSPVGQWLFVTLPMWIMTSPLSLVLAGIGSMVGLLGVFVIILVEAVHGLPTG